MANPHPHPDPDKPDTKTRIEREVNAAVDRTWTLRWWRILVGVMSILGPLIVGLLLYAHRGFIRDEIRNHLQGYVEKDRYDRDQLAVAVRLDNIERRADNSMVELRNGQAALLAKINEMDRKLAVLEAVNSKLDKLAR